MQLAMYTVQVDADTTRFFKVPAYDVPIIRALWGPEIARKAHLGRKITVSDTGIIEPRNLYEEKLRLRSEYAAAIDGDSLPAWRRIYPTDEAIAEAYRDAVADADERLSCAAAGDAGAAQGSAPADPNPKSKGGRPRRMTFTQPSEPAPVMAGAEG